MGLRGLRVALTGGLAGTTREELRSLLEAEGATLVGSLDDTVDLLVVGEAPLASRVQRAEVLGIRQIDEVMLEALWMAAPEPELLASAPLWERTETSVRIADLVVPRIAPGPLTPSLASFAAYVLDGPTADLLRALARAVVLKQPALVVGPTSTSKTSAIRCLAANVGAEVVRVNLNGQTETGELIGRYVPEGSGWRFAEGAVPRAMRQGQWLVLDEVNLAAPAVLERLNPVLEREPSLVLTEGDGERFGPGGTAVHADFRVFATMNPPRYVGRSVLSPAWRDRFTAQVQADPPGEDEFLQLLELLATGRHPDVELQGRRWSGDTVTAPAPELAACAERFPAVARWFAGLAALAAGPDPLGADVREPFVVSRRSLLGVVDALRTLRRWDPERGEVGLAEDPSGTLSEALRAAVVGRLASEADIQRVFDLLRTYDL